MDEQAGGLIVCSTTQEEVELCVGLDEGCASKPLMQRCTSTRLREVRSISSRAVGGYKRELAAGSHSLLLADEFQLERGRVVWAAACCAASLSDSSRSLWTNAFYLTAPFALR